MSVRLVVKNSSPASASPYRLLDDHGREITWANQFLDAQTVRQLSLRSLRAYAYDLLHLARWFRSTRHSLGRLNQSLLLKYVRHQLEQPPSPTPQTINHRLCVLRCLYRFHHAQEIPGKPLFPRRYTTRSSLGYGHRQTKITTNLRLRQPRRVIVPSPLTRSPASGKAFAPPRSRHGRPHVAKRLALLRGPATPAGRSPALRSTPPRLR